jgi:hypothetical protein
MWWKLIWKVEAKAYMTILRVWHGLERVEKRHVFRCPSEGKLQEIMSGNWSLDTVLVADTGIWERRKISGVRRSSIQSVGLFRPAPWDTESNHYVV